MSYNVPCGAAGWPLCRWLCTCAGLWVFPHPQAAAFLFFKGIIAKCRPHCKGVCQKKQDFTKKQEFVKKSREGLWPSRPVCGQRCLAERIVWQNALSGRMRCLAECAA